MLRVMEGRAWILAVLACVACAPPGSEGSEEAGVAAEAETTEAAPPAQPASPEAEAVLAAVETVLQAINSADSDLARTVVPADAQVVAVRVDARSAIAGEDFASGIGDPEQGFVERMWDPEVKLLGPVATVWAPYDFYIHGAFSHCGVDTFQLIRDGDAWKVQSLVYNVLQPPECDTHPEGPPSA